MKKSLSNFFKISIPLFLGVFICWFFWNQFSIEDKKAFYNIFLEADYFILFISLFIGFLSHLARAKRWIYALAPIGYQPSFWRCYHAIMVGYIMNLVFPRLGEMSRAGTLTKNKLNTP